MARRVRRSPVSDAARRAGRLHLRFEIAPTPEGSTLPFTHEGLVPEHDCYGACESAWTVLLEKNLVTLLAGGEDQPSPWR